MATFSLTSKIKMTTILGVGSGVFILCMLWAATALLCMVISQRENKSSSGLIYDNNTNFGCYPTGYKSSEK
ncbi:unnamed protein product [Heterobilharzia americana]|nr:unnamed protein product [Heterobilharzia americana]